jgi:RNA polymerase sigma-70 factor (ECF subfamily)
MRSDRDLIDRLRRADPDAFAAVYEAEKGRVYGFLVRLSRDPEVAADLFQNVWMKLARNAPQLREDSNVGAWLLTVARREYVSFRRAQALDLSRVLLLGVCRPDFPTAARETELDLMQALGRVADADREVLLLAASGLDQAELANVLGVSVVAARQRLARARQRFTRALREAPAQVQDAVAAKGAR